MITAVLPQMLCSAVLFIVVWIVLGNYVFKPFFALLEEREERTVGDEKRAVKRREEARQLQERIDTTLFQTRLRAIEQRDVKLATARAEAQKVIDEALERAHRELRAAREEIADLKVRARKQMGGEVKALSDTFVNKLLADGTSKLVH